MGIMFSRATKKQAKARIALLGPAGAGKTYSALKIARGLAGEDGRIALIDTERRSASKYSDLFAFDVAELESFEPENYIEAIEAASAAGYNVLIIDSLSHAWSGKGGILEFVDMKAKASQSGNSYVAWRDATPKHNALVDAMLSCACHLIVTMRVKMEYVQEKNGKGKTEVRKIGLQPIQRDGLEYEFDVVADLTNDNCMIVSKTRCSALTGMVVAKPDEKFGEKVLAWLTDGAAVPTTLTLTINGKTHVTAGITKDTILELWNLSTKYEKHAGKGAAKALLATCTSKASSVELTEAAGVAFLVALRSGIAEAEAAVAHAAANAVA